MTPTPLSSAANRTSGLIALIASLQCVCVLDFMLVLPLGADLSQAFGIPSHQIAWLTAAYTLASLLSGLLAVPYLDRLDRRLALLWSLSGMSLAITACTLSQQFFSLVIFRAVAGFFAAPAIASGMAILIDHTSPAQRGTAIAKVMSGFSIATIAGIPLSLEVSAQAGWRASFLLLGVLVGLVGLAAAFVLSPQTQHQSGRTTQKTLRLLQRPRVRLASLVQMMNQWAAFLVIPHMAAFYLLNLTFPRAQLGLLYLMGGLCTLLALQLMGRCIDRYGTQGALWLASIIFMLGQLPLLGLEAAPMTLCFVLFMSGNAARTLCLASELSHIPAPHERAGFMALQKMNQDFGVMLAAISSALILEPNDGPLVGMPLLASFSLVGGLGVIMLVRLLQRHQP